MERIELEGRIDQEHRLSVVLPSHVPAGKVKVVLEPLGDDETETEWSRWIAHIWGPELSDPREDIYTLDDGEPVDR